MSVAPAEGRVRLAALAERLAAAGIAEPRRELRLLQIEAGGEASIADWPDSPHPGLEALTARRAAREPVSRIVGRREFWSRDFLLTPDVFDPRPDSETVVEAALATVPSFRTVLDLGTGSGCLLAALLAERPEARGLGIDRSPGACRAARRNLEGLPAVVAAGDWARAVAGRFDLVVSNPPYIPSAEIAALMPEVRDHDPRLALDGGADGLGAYRAILGDLPRLLSPGGTAVLELGFGQAEAIAAFAGTAGLRVVDIRADLGGIPRAMVLGSRL